MGKSKMFQTTNQITYNNNSHPIAFHVSAIVTAKLVVLLWILKILPMIIDPK